MAFPLSIPAIRNSFAQGESAKPRESDILWGSPPADEAELHAREAALTQPVPLLLEAMNSAAAEVNALEQQMVDVREQCLRLTQRNGGAVRPDLLERVQTAAREFQAAAARYAETRAALRAFECLLAGTKSLNLDQQDELAEATRKVGVCQQERDSLEKLHLCALEEYICAVKEGCSSVPEPPGVTGTKTIAMNSMVAVRAFLRATSTRKSRRLAAHQRTLCSLSMRLQVAKHTYRRSMQELESISSAVHQERRMYSATDS